MHRLPTALLAPRYDYFSAPNSVRIIELPIIEKKIKYYNRLQFTLENSRKASFMFISKKHTKKEIEELKIRIVKLENLDNQSEIPKNNRFWRILRDISTIAASIATAASLFYITLQTNEIQKQTQISSQQNESLIRSQDLEYLAKINISPSDEGIRIENSSETPIKSIAYWFLMRKEDTLEVFDTTGAIGPLGSCTAATIDWNFFKYYSGQHSYNVENIKKFSPGFTKEFHLVFQAPSGKWYFKGSTGLLQEIVDNSTFSSKDPSANPIDKSNVYSEPDDNFHQTEYKALDKLKELDVYSQYENFLIAVQNVYFDDTPPIYGAGDSILLGNGGVEGLEYLTYTPVPCAST